MKEKSRLSDNMKDLDYYLSQYHYAVIEKDSLRHRQRELRNEFNAPLHGGRMENSGRKPAESEGSASISIRLDEINRRIDDQVRHSEKVLLEIMDIIDYLPPHSLERLIFEHRYIDRYGWEKICRVCHISRTPAFNHWRLGLEKLLTYDRIKKIISEYKG